MAQQRAFQSVRSALVASRVPSDFELAAVLHRAVELERTTSDQDDALPGIFMRRLLPCLRKFRPRPLARVIIELQRAQWVVPDTVVVKALNRTRSLLRSAHQLSHGDLVRMAIPFATKSSSLSWRDPFCLDQMALATLNRLDTMPCSKLVAMATHLVSAGYDNVEFYARVISQAASQADRLTTVEVRDVLHVFAMSRCAPDAVDVLCRQLWRCRLEDVPASVIVDLVRSLTSGDDVRDARLLERIAMHAVKNAEMFDVEHLVALCIAFIRHVDLRKTIGARSLFITTRARLAPCNLMAIPPGLLSDIVRVFVRNGDVVGDGCTIGLQTRLSSCVLHRIDALPSDRLVALGSAFLRTLKKNPSLATAIAIRLDQEQWRFTAVELRTWIQSLALNPTIPALQSPLGQAVSMAFNRVAQFDTPALIQMANSLVGRGHERLPLAAAIVLELVERVNDVALDALTAKQRATLIMLLTRMSSLRSDVMSVFVERCMTRTSSAEEIAAVMWAVARDVFTVPDEFWAVSTKKVLSGTPSLAVASRAAWAIAAADALHVEGADVSALWALILHRTRETQPPDASLRQTWQALCWTRMRRYALPQDNDADVRLVELVSHSAMLFAPRAPPSSWLDHLEDTLARIQSGRTERNVLCPTTAYRLHMTVNPPGSRHRVGIVLLSPHCYVAGRILTGGAQLRQRLLLWAGWRLLSIPFWEWPASSPESYLSARLEQLGDFAAAPIN
ncbi:unnamed protein product (mitochondrion) [Plasmodiophora brassicae]|uniref:RAP domain-containing protein n=1 Tax=Plasmodiophora brassicae TaxID=37360 RepID=A0A0G4J3U9_PLABS|nr:hypothetical protein PBRA_002431 [Plasmodiophora brassicae]SPQ93643.1 unnamed protein product [Plasmodiophora brassicae]